MSLKELLGNAKVAAVICNQWGDTGKGKMVDLLASEWADVIARGTGGNNAGHTVVVNGKQRIFHIIPSGITQDHRGKINILGNGMVIDPAVLVQEMDELDRERISYNHLMVSSEAHVIMPHHVERDRRRDQSQENGGIGSTGRGIGPTYTDKVAREGILIRDLLDKDVLKRKIEAAQERYSGQKINVEEVIARLEPLTERIRPHVRSTANEIQRMMRKGKKVLLEGAQGLLLSVEHGTYPYVTSSDPSLNGTATGVGIPASAVNITLGIVKFPFMTRVGGGPFPTELGGRESEDYCAKGLEHDIFYEVKEHLGMDIDLLKVRKLQNSNANKELAALEREVTDYIKSNRERIVNLINSPDPFQKGVGIRLAAGEYGATTKRPRRTGWTDATAAKYAVGLNGGLIVLTKPDCLAGAEQFSVSFDYETPGGTTSDFSRDERVLRESEGVLKTYPGYESISQARTYDELPGSLRDAISDLERFTHGRVAAVSVGAERDATIFRD